MRKISPEGLARCGARRTSGFTLVEVVRALVVMSILMVGVAMGLRMGIVAWEKGEARAEEHQRLRGVVRLLTEEIASADPYPVMFQGQRTYPFHAESNALSFVSASTRESSGRGGLALIKYELGFEPKEGWKLMRIEAPLPNGEEILDWQRSAHGGSALMEGLGEVRFFYHRKPRSGDARSEWLERWDPMAEEGLPNGVLVRISSMDPTDPLLVSQHVLIHAEAERGVQGRIGGPGASGLGGRSDSGIGARR
jgi:general secretion pathway protein J